MRGDGWAHYTKCPSVCQLSGSVPDVDPSSPALMLTVPRIGHSVGLGGHVRCVSDT